MFPAIIYRFLKATNTVLGLFFGENRLTKIGAGRVIDGSGEVSLGSMERGGAGNR